MAAESRRRPSNKVVEASVVVTAASEVEPLAHPDPVEAWEVVQEEMLAVSLFIFFIILHFFPSLFFFDSTSRIK